MLWGVTSRDYLKTMTGAVYSAAFVAAPKLFRGRKGFSVTGGFPPKARTNDVSRGTGCSVITESQNRLGWKGAEILPCPSTIPGCSKLPGMGLIVFTHPKGHRKCLCAVPSHIQHDLTATGSRPHSVLGWWPHPSQPSCRGSLWCQDPWWRRTLHLQVKSTNLYQL